MSRIKIAGPLLVRFILCFVLIGCVWIVSIRYRMGPFDYRGEATFANNSGAFPDSDRLLLVATLGLMSGLLGLYRSGQRSAMIMVLVSLLAITAVDHLWSVYGDFDEYKGVPGYVFQPAIATVLIGPLAFLFPPGREASSSVVAACWAVLVLIILLIGSQSIGTNVLHLEGMIGPSYMQNVFLCLLVAEAAQQARRLHRVLRIDHRHNSLG